MTDHELSEEYYEELQAIIAANGDITQRACEKLSAFYDEEDNLFTLTIGKDEGAMSITVEDVLVIRYDEDTYKIIAFELYCFREILGEQSPFVPLVFGLMEQCGPVAIRLQPSADFSAEFAALPALARA